MRRLALVLALLAVIALPSGAVASGPSLDGGRTIGPLQATADPTRDASTAPVTTEMTVELRETGAARWHVAMRYPLTSANETDAFREYGETFERGETDHALDVETFDYLADGASSVAGREMTIQNVSRSATVADDVGVLELSFTWTAFLSTDGEQLVLRDALRLPNDRTWLATLEPTQRLVIETPPGYAINATNAPLVQRSGSIIIDGPRTFDTDEPLTIRYEATADVAGFPTELIAGSALAVVVILAVLVRRRRGAGWPLFGSREDEPEPDAPAAESTGTSPADEASPTGEPGAEGPDSRPGQPDATPEGPEKTSEEPDTAPEESTDEEDSGPDLSLLSDEERVEHLVEQNGGRMRQADIVEETGWSDAKVSQLLSAMAEDDRVEKLRLGRENLISLPEDEDERE